MITYQRPFRDRIFGTPIEYQKSRKQYMQRWMLETLFAFWEASTMQEGTIWHKIKSAQCMVSSSVEDIYEQR